MLAGCDLTARTVFGWYFVFLMYFEGKRPGNRDIFLLSRNLLDK